MSSRLYALATCLPLSIAYAFGGIARPPVHASHRRAVDIDARPVFPRADSHILQADLFTDSTFSVLGSYINITVGTPPQTQTLSLSTNSADLILISSDAVNCVESSSNCPGGTYDSQNSSTYALISSSPAYNATFGDGTTFTGGLASDIVGIDGYSISGVNFALSQSVTVNGTPGLLGLGYETLEPELGDSSHVNFLSNLVRSGVINSRVYSTDLGGSASGTILFGGLDTTKYTGDLVLVDFLPDNMNGTSSDINYFKTMVTAANLTANGTTTPIWTGGSTNIGGAQSNSSGIPYILDAGSTLMYLPQTYYSNVVQPAFPNVDNNTLDCSCAYAASDTYFSLNIDNKTTIRIDANNFVVPVINETTGQSVPYNDQGDTTCSFLIQPLEDGFGDFILGQSFLRSMYIVYDLDNNQSAIAQAATAVSNNTNIVEVKAGPNGVANAAGITPSSSSNSTADTSATDSENPNHTGAIAGGVVGGVAGLALIAALLYFLLIRRRKKQQKPQPTAAAPQTFEKAELPGEESAVGSDQKVDSQKSKPSYVELDDEAQVQEADGAMKPPELDNHGIVAELEGDFQAAELAGEQKR